MRPDSDCPHYNWGGTNKHPSYPKEYGPRCEYHQKFFSGNQPNCIGCQHKEPQLIQIQVEVPSGGWCTGCRYLGSSHRFCNLWYKAIYDNIKCDLCKGAPCIS